jgi:cbb3-type cytochrome oxidase maturation protein
MSVIIVLIGFSLLVAIIFLVAFLWSVKSGQYEDDYTPSVRILFDDEKPSNKKEGNDSDNSVTEANKPNNH